jgi:hypothetical protein
MNVAWSTKPGKSWGIRILSKRRETSSLNTLALGLCLGIAVGVVVNNLLIGLCLGLVFDAALGRRRAEPDA